MLEALHFINNEFVPSIGGETLKVVNPTSEEVAGTAASAQVADVDVAVSRYSCSLMNSAERVCFIGGCS